MHIHPLSGLQTTYSPMLLGEHADAATCPGRLCQHWTRPILSGPFDRSCEYTTMLPSFPMTNMTSCHTRGQAVLISYSPSVSHPLETMGSLCSRKPLLPL